MSSLNHIGIDSHKAEELAHNLQMLLANYSIFYQNVRGFHWNIKGNKFFELHLKFEELYNDLLLKIDEIAERILTLGKSPEHSYSKYSQISSIAITDHISDGERAVANILDSMKTTITLQRAILTLANEANDEGTNALMSDYIAQQEKLVWMYSSFLA